MKEIERKWLMREFPEHLECIQRAIVKQFYITFEPELRVRKKRYLTLSENIVEYNLESKTNGELVREEAKTSLYPYQYKILESFFCNENNSLIKYYKIYKLGKYELEVSRVDNKFYYAEIEFDTVSEASNFITPAWFGREVTYDCNWKMKNYVKNRNEDIGKTYIFS